jgi:hypothetical protein
MLVELIVYIGDLRLVGTDVMYVMYLNMTRQGEILLLILSPGQNQLIFQ